MTGRLLGIDFGARRVGVAVCDPDRRIASPWATYERQTEAKDAEYFRSLVASENIVEIIVGLPVHTSGEEGVKAGEARTYGTWLQNVVGRPVRYWDERFTTVHAESALWSAGLTHKKRKERRDRVAAQMMLQSYLDAGCPDHDGAGPLT